MLCPLHSGAGLLAPWVRVWVCWQSFWRDGVLKQFEAVWSCISMMSHDFEYFLKRLLRCVFLLLKILCSDQSPIFWLCCFLDVLIFQFFVSSRHWSSVRCKGDKDFLPFCGLRLHWRDHFLSCAKLFSFLSPVCQLLVLLPELLEFYSRSLCLSLSA